MRKTGVHIREGAVEPCDTWCVMSREGVLRAWWVSWSWCVDWRSPGSRVWKSSAV